MLPSERAPSGGFVSAEHITLRLSFPTAEIAAPRPGLKNYAVRFIKSQVRELRSKVSLASRPLLYLLSNRSNSLPLPEAQDSAHSALARHARRQLPKWQRY